MAVRNPMNQKVVRLTKANQELTKTNATLERELSELREESFVMVRMFQDQLAQSHRREHERKEEAIVRKADLAVLQAPVDEAAVAAEVSQLQEELERVKLAGKRRLEQKSKEVSQLKADLQQRRDQQERLRRASQAIGASADADLGELSHLRSRSQQLENEIEELEAENLKMACQVDAWGVRLAETHRLAAESDVKGDVKESEMLTSLDDLRASAAKMRKLSADANAQCGQIKQKLDDPEGLRPVREYGMQTRYLSEHTHLREQVEKLTRELERARATAGTPTVGVISNLMSFCLRPRFDDPNAQRPASLPPSRPTTPRAALPNAPSDGGLSASARRPLMV